MMAAMILPVTLHGDNLGDRHHQLNDLVNEAYLKNIPFTTIKNLPEKSALDRLFKIDLASKYKDVDYIIENLKDEDMLYVSRALRCRWLLNEEYMEIINPLYLENVLYPKMTTTAVNKMKHWIELNLKDPERSKEFYQFYVKNGYGASIKFIFKCSKDFIVSEVKKDLLKDIEPHHFKVLIEKCPDVAKIYYESLESNDTVLEQYIRKQKKYYGALKSLLKVNGDDFLNITEKYFDSNSFRRFSPEATKYVLKNYKDRFLKKPELYTSILLDVTTLADHLTEEEIKELIMKLARAEYIQYWFTYKNVEPLIKKLSVEERSSFKKLVFEEKSIGDVVEEWPYDTPSSPTLKSIERNIFEDAEHEPYEYDVTNEGFDNFRCQLRRIKKKCGKWENVDIIRKTSLDNMFDRYRFAGFEKTFYDLRKQLRVETLQHRQNIMLVLISKSGGRAESLEELLRFLVNHHENEPENLRATVIRSLVRRCCIWRLPQNVWELLLKFGQGIGLDGASSTVACREGLHAVVIRNIILNQNIDSAVWKAFMDEFSTLTEYSLNAAEKEKISTALPELLITAAKNETDRAVNILGNALDILDAYKISIEKCPNFIATTTTITHNNADSEILLRRLFNARIARKELFKPYFAIIQNDASYYNALKHDINVLANGETFEALIKSNRLAHDKFITTMSLYFNEENGLGAKFLALLQNNIKDENLKRHKIARHIVILSGTSLIEIMKEFNGAPKKSEFRRISAALWANSHLTRPSIKLNSLNFRMIGAKAVSTCLLQCSTIDIDEHLKYLISWERTQRIAFILSSRVGKEANILRVIGQKRPRVALKIILQHLRTMKVDEAVWTTIIHLITKLNNPDKIHERLRKTLNNVKIVPVNRRKDYYIAVFEKFCKITRRKYCEMPVLCSMENILFEVDPTFIETVLRRFLIEEFSIKKLHEQDNVFDLRAGLHLRIIAKYLLLCKNNIEQESRWKNVGELFFDCGEDIWNAKPTWEEQKKLKCYINEFLQCLKYTKVFLDISYVSCLPTLQRIVYRLQNIFQIHKHFELYVHLHLTMLYSKTVRQSIKNNATVFDDLPRNVNQAAEIIGRVFGKYIAQEAVELTDKYFESIIEIYKKHLEYYFDSYFEYCETWIIMVTNIIKSFLEHKSRKAHLLAVHMYKSLSYHNWSQKERAEILEKLNAINDMEIILSLN